MTITIQPGEDFRFDAPRRRREYQAAAGATVSPRPEDIQGSPALLQGRRLTCPGCEVQQDLLDFVPFEYSEKFADQVIAPLRCRECGHIFALHPNPGGADA